jgi:hypothetical protein
MLARIANNGFAEGRGIALKNALTAADHFVQQRDNIDAIVTAVGAGREVSRGVLNGASLELAEAYRQMAARPGGTGAPSGGTGGTPGGTGGTPGGTGGPSGGVHPIPFGESLTTPTQPATDEQKKKSQPAATEVGDEKSQPAPIGAGGETPEIDLTGVPVTHDKPPHQWVDTGSQASTVVQSYADSRTPSRIAAELPGLASTIAGYNPSDTATVVQGASGVAFGDELASYVRKQGDVCQWMPEAWRARMTRGGDISQNDALVFAQGLYELGQRGTAADAVVATTLARQLPMRADLRHQVTEFIRKICGVGGTRTGAPVQTPPVVVPPPTAPAPPQAEVGRHRTASIFTSPPDLGGTDDALKKRNNRAKVYELEDKLIQNLNASEKNRINRTGWPRPSGSKAGRLDHAHFKLTTGRARLKKQIEHFKQQGTQLGIHSYKSPSRTRIATPGRGPEPAFGDEKDAQGWGTKRPAEEPAFGDEKSQGGIKLGQVWSAEERQAEQRRAEPFDPAIADFDYTPAATAIDTELFKTGLPLATAKLEASYRRAPAQVPGEGRTVGEQGDPYGISDKIGPWLKTRPTEAAVKKKIKELKASQRRAKSNLDESADWLQVKHKALSLNKKQVSEFKHLLRNITKRGDIGAAEEIKQKFFKELKAKFKGKKWPDEDWSVTLPKGWGGSKIYNHQEHDRLGLKTQIQNLYHNLDKSKGRIARVADQSYLAVFEAIGAPKSFLTAYRQIVEDIHGDHTRNEKRFAENTEAGIELENYLKGVDYDQALKDVRPYSPPPKKRKPRAKKGVHTSNVQKARAAARFAETAQTMDAPRKKAKRSKPKPKPKPKPKAAKPKAAKAAEPAEPARTVALYTPILDRPVRRRAAAGQTQRKRRALNKPKPKGPSMWRSVGTEGPYGGLGTKEAGTGRIIPPGFTKGADGRLKPSRRTRGRN